MKIILLGIVPLILLSLFIFFVTHADCANYFGGTVTIVSFLTALFTYFYVALTGLMVRQMVKAQEDERRPYVLAHLEFDQHMSYIVISNTGRRPAKNLTIKIDPPLIGLRNTDIGQKFFSKPISFFPHGKVFRSVVNSSLEMFKEGFIDEYKFTISYSWEGQTSPVSEEYTTNIGFNKGRWGVDKKDIDDIANALESIEKHLETMAKNKI